MRLPIQYALTWPERLPLQEDHPLNLLEIGTLHFDAPDTERFPLLKLAYEAGEKGGNLDAVMNGANEVANLAFRNHEIPFLSIERIITDAVHQAPFHEVTCIEDLIEADRWSREFAAEEVQRDKEN
jgi:1-deoxy-D-xylulose-5-phosphate reductoisomerase